MKKYVFIIAVLFCAMTVSAQDDISKQMEVTKAYTPKVGRAAKLSVEPRMIDTVQLRPQIDYAITPTAWQTVFEARKFRPASISVTPYEKNRPFYLRGGAGFPLQSTADLYFNPYTGNRSTFGMFFNHRGSYASIENELGQKPNSTEMLNRGGLYGSKHYSRYKLEGDVEYDNRLYHAYGAAQRDILSGITATPWDGLRLNYGRVRGSVQFGDTFTDLSRFNFNVGLNTGFSHERYGSNQVDIDVWAAIGMMVHPKHGFELSFYERGFVGAKELRNMYSVAAIFSPRYILALDKFMLRAGIDFYYVKSKHHNMGYGDVNENDWKVAPPEIEAVWNVGNGYFTPYLKASSQMLDGSFEALSRKNPYLLPGTTAPVGWTYDLRLGFTGSVNSIFSYRVFGGASWLQNFHVFYNLHEFMSDDTVVFGAAYDNGMMYTVGAELELALPAGFSAKLSGNWYGYEFDKLLSAGGLPSYDAGLGLSYTHSKFKVSAGAKLSGERNFLDWYNMPGYTDFMDGLRRNRAGAAVDVSLAADVKLFDNFWVFAEGNNLANQKLYSYNHYKGQGVNVMIGIKAVF